MVIVLIAMPSYKCDILLHKESLIECAACKVITLGRVYTVKLSNVHTSF